MIILDVFVGCSSIQVEGRKSCFVQSVEIGGRQRPVAQREIVRNTLVSSSRPRIIADDYLAGMYRGIHS